MCPSDEHLHTLSQVDVAELEQAKSRFQEAWSKSPRPKLVDFCPRNSVFAIRALSRARGI